MFLWYKYLIVSLVFSHLGFWSGNLSLIAPFPDLCLLVLFSNLKHLEAMLPMFLLLPKDQTFIFYDVYVCRRQQIGHSQVHGTALLVSWVLV